MKHAKINHEITKLSPVFMMPCTKPTIIITNDKSNYPPEKKAPHISNIIKILWKIGNWLLVVPPKFNKNKRSKYWSWYGIQFVRHHCISYINGSQK